MSKIADNNGDKKNANSIVKAIEIGTKMLSPLCNTSSD